MSFAKNKKMILPNEKFIETFKKTPGALSVTESIAIMNIAARSPKGMYVEFGSHKGKSAMSAIYGLRPQRFYLDDIIFSDRELIATVDRAIRDAIDYDIELGFYEVESLMLLQKIKDIAYAFVDTGVHDDMVMEEVKLLEDKMVQSGIICFHDYLNQFTAVERAYKYLLSTNKYDEIRVDWQPIIEYARLNDLEKGNDSWHLYEEHPFPNFVGALIKK